MRLDRFFLPRIVLQGAETIRDRIAAVVTDKQYKRYKRGRSSYTGTEYKQAVAKEKCGYVISSCEAENYDYRDYDYYKKRRMTQGGYINLNRKQTLRDVSEQPAETKVQGRKHNDVIVGKCMAVIIFIAIYLLVPAIVTLKLTGVVDNPVDDEITDGKTITINYKNADQRIDVEKFIGMVLADRLYMGAEVELLRAESIMIRTDIYRIMDEQMNITAEQTGMNYLTISQMKKLWKQAYTDNYNLIYDCVASTKGMAIQHNGQYIDARYTYISQGRTLCGADILGDTYSYLQAVDCPQDKEAKEYLVVKTISSKAFVNAFEKMYDGLKLDKNELDKQVQTVSSDKNGYVLKMQVGNVVMTGSTFAGILGINSPCFKLEYMDSGVKVTTTGVGDGLGMSIYTAGRMAEEGAACEDILKNFYADITID